MTGNRPRIDNQTLRQALGCFTTGVAVVTTLGDNNAPVGLTVNSFSSVSLDPPLILWSIGLNAPSLGAFREHPTFVVNILSAEQQALCQQFAQPAEDKFNGIDWEHGLNGAPVLANSLAVLQCRSYERYPGGDHEIQLGEVMTLEYHDKEPLVFHRGQFAKNFTY